MLFVNPSVYTCARVTNSFNPGKTGHESTMSAKSNAEDPNSDFPSELTVPVSDFHEALTQLNGHLDPWLAVSPEELKSDLEPLAQAKIDLVSAFALNSLVWMWMRTQGQDPKESEVKTELDRVKSCMVRLKEIQDRSKRPAINLPAVKRMVNSGLWQPNTEKTGSCSPGSGLKTKRLRK